MAVLQFVAVLAVLAGTPSAARPSPPAPPPPSGGEADIAEVFHYVLTQEGLDKFLAITEAVQRLVDKTPDLERRMATKTPAERTLDAGVRSLEQDFPEVAALVHKHGLKSRDYVVMGGAVSAAFTAVGMKRLGAAADYPPQLPPENTALVERNYERLESIMQIEAPPDTKPR